MIILYVPLVAGVVSPIVILDYTRSDDQYSPAQITQYVLGLGTQAAQGKVIDISSLSVYSLNYSMTFKHSANNYGDSLKTKFSATIENAPTELVGLLNIKQYLSQENIDALKGALNSVIDPEAFFPTGAFVIKQNSNTAPTIVNTITRTFMLYDTPYNFDPRRINSTLILNGSEFDSMVMRLQFAVNLSASKGPLTTQLSAILAKQGFVLYADTTTNALLPKIDRYYPPAPMNKILNNVCRDNELMFTVDSDQRTVKLQSIGSIPPIPSSPITPSLCFGNYVPNTYLISSFSLQNYVICNFKAEAFDVTLFDTVLVYDDTKTSDALTFRGGVFSNLSKAVPFFIIGKNEIFSYTFYVLEYTYTDNRNETSITIRGTNNWLLSNFKLDSFLENKIYLAPHSPLNLPVFGAPL